MTIFRKLCVIPSKRFEQDWKSAVSNQLNSDRRHLKRPTSVQRDGKSPKIRFPDNEVVKVAACKPSLKNASPVNLGDPPFVASHVAFAVPRGISKSRQFKIDKEFGKETVRAQKNLGTMAFRGLIFQWRITGSNR